MTSLSKENNDSKVGYRNANIEFFNGVATTTQPLRGADLRR